MAHRRDSKDKKKADKEVEEAQAKFASDLEPAIAETMNIAADKVYQLTGKEIMTLTAAACTEVMSGFITKMDGIIKGDVYVEYLVTQVMEELGADAQKLVTVSRELARVSRELDTMKAIVNDLMEKEDVAVTSTCQDGMNYTTANIPPEGS